MKVQDCKTLSDMYLWLEKASLPEIENIITGTVEKTPEMEELCEYLLSLEDEVLFVRWLRFIVHTNNPYMSKILGRYYNNTLFPKAKGIKMTKPEIFVQINEEVKDYDRTNSKSREGSI